MISIVTRDPAHEGDQRKTRVLGWKEARLGLVYSQGSFDPVFGVSTAGVDQAGDQLGSCATRIGLDAHIQLHAVGDGAPWIADQTDRMFGAQSNYLVDFYHLCEYLAAASKGCAADQRAWYNTRKRQTKSRQVAAVLAALAPHLEPLEVDDSNAPVRACHRYLRNRLGQFDYPKAEQAGLPIGSGKIESAHRYVIRIKILGASWLIEKADKMLALRVTGSTESRKTTGMRAKWHEFPHFESHPRASDHFVRRSKLRFGAAQENIIRVLDRRLRVRGKAIHV